LQDEKLDAAFPNPPKVTAGTVVAHTTNVPVFA